MGLITLPYNWSDSVVITAANLNILNTTIYNEFNGNIDNTNIKSGANIDAAKLLNASILAAKIADGAITDTKLDYTSTKIIRAGVPGIKFARGGRSVTFSAGRISPNPTVITFSTDSDDGNPAFTATPRFGGIILATTGGNIYQYVLRALSSASASIDSISTNGTDAGTYTFIWWAWGI